MNRSHATRTALALAAVLAAAPAAAERGAGEVYSRDTYPYGEIVNQPLTLPASLLRIEYALEQAAGVDVPFRVPFAVGAELEPIRKLAIGGELAFPNLLGEDATADERELVVFLRLFI